MAEKGVRGGAEQAESLARQGVAPAAGTASGVAAANRDAESTRTEDKKAEKISDTLLKPGKSTGAQLEAAIMTPSGSVPHNTVGSPSGPVPVSAVTTDADEAETKLEENAAQTEREESGAFIEEDLLNRLSRADIRAVAHDRGYDIGEGSRRVLRKRFLKAQDEDEDIEAPKKSKKGK